MEASAIPQTAGLARTRIAIGAPLLRLRSDEQLVSMFRAGSEEAFRAIHDRYRARLVAYTRQMLAGSPADAEDAVQEIFVRAYAGLRANDRELALRAWLYRIAHNRCIDELRRPLPLASGEMIESMVRDLGIDPFARVEQRDALRRLIDDVQRLPEQQRSALLMRELGGVSYAEMSAVLGVSVPAIKSLLVRARIGLAQASEARDATCSTIRESLIVSHDRGVRASGLARRHLRDCSACREFRGDVQSVSRQLAALTPVLGPIAVIAKLLGIGGAGSGGAAAGSGGAGAATGATAAGGATAVGGAGAAGVLTVGAGHVATILAAAVVTAGGALELQHVSPVVHRVHHHHTLVVSAASSTAPRYAAEVTSAQSSSGSAAPVTVSASTSRPATEGGATIPAAAPAGGGGSTKATRSATRSVRPGALPISETMDPDQTPYVVAGTGTSTSPTTSATPAGTSTSAGGTATAPAASPGTTTTPSTTTPTTPTTPGSTTAPATPGTSTTPATSSSPTTATGVTPTAGAAPATASSGTVTSASTGKVSSPTHGSIGRHHRTIAVFTMTGN